ncbi:hypothetical protein J3E68DRAFT_87843 [Trichoderma sp. SZMC 28012]
MSATSGIPPAARLKDDNAKKASTGKSICLKQAAGAPGAPLDNLASTSVGKRDPGGGSPLGWVSWIFWYLQKCHVNDSLVHTWHSIILGFSGQSTLHAVQCIFSLPGTKMQGPGSAYNPTSTACTVLTADASHHGQDKPNQLLRKRQNIHSFKHTVSLLACPCLLKHRLALCPTNSYNHLLISSHQRTTITHTVLILISILVYTNKQQKNTTRNHPHLHPLYPPLGQCRPPAPSPSPQPFPKK